ncbi:MAG TPA: hemerythrin domain-containing protein, partial [Nakamurella sp.]
PADILRIYNVNGRFSTNGRGFLDGPPRMWAEHLTELVLTQGFSSFVLGATDDIVAAVSTFAEEVAPDVRERVLAERAESGGQNAGRPIFLGRESGAESGLSGPGRTGAPPEPAAERDGNWRTAGGLPVADRPSAVRSDTVTARPVTAPAIGRDNHRNLVAIHDHLRSELEQIGQAVNQVAAGELAPGAARSLINRMTMRQNHWTLGSFCASYCRIVTLHHTIEDTHMFPGLAAVAPSLQPVLDRLEAEHLVIAGVLDRFDRALVDLVREEDGAEVPARAGTAEIGSLAIELGDVLLSHLAYEEDQLAEGLALMPAI